MSKAAPERIDLNDIRFERRDPEKIGNGFHDYDIFVEDYRMGDISFGGTPQYGPQVPPVTVVFGGYEHGIRYNLPITLAKLSTLPSNEKIFDTLRPMILQAWRVYQEN